MITQEQINAYALALLRMGDDRYFEAAQYVVGGDALAAIRFGAEVSKPETKAQVDAAKDQLLEEYGDDAFLPTKVETAREIWRLATDMHAEPKDRVAAFKLYSEIREFMPKKDALPSGTVNNTNVTNNVMIVRESPNDEEWRRKAAEQQARLMHEVTEAAKTN